ncbi:hypothetical protein EVG20_g4410 [Dentipellis fragilis]|uniref:CTLH domain-containing protein n=1 Tax=Dentipellis fragilis TaxID=205917 RepID=A0A4Y9YYI4_9AGAM|nr:hypothetical protein EVG20_g4410 [Dentipellis fragilis]
MCRRSMDYRRVRRHGITVVSRFLCRCAAASSPTMSSSMYAALFHLPIFSAVFGGVPLPLRLVNIVLPEQTREANRIFIVVLSLRRACPSSSAPILHVATIDPLPSPTTPSRDTVPDVHQPHTHSPTRGTLTAASPSHSSPARAAHIGSSSPLIPATRTRSQLESDNRSEITSYHSSQQRSATTLGDRERARKRQRVDSTSTSASASTSISAVDRSLFSDDNPHSTAMRLPENDSLSVSPDFTPEAGPSTLTPPLPSKIHTNGNSNGFTSSAVTNGVSKHAKAPISRVTLPGTTLYEDSHIDREEFVRLIIQSLRDVGYIESAATLEAESGYVMESPEVSEFRQCIIDGDWGEAEAALTRLGVSEDDGLWEAKFLINQQKYLEYLEAGRSTAALHVLRNELAPLNMEPEQLQPLSSLMMYTDPAELRQKAGWDGYIPSSVMIPPRRFASLLDQSQQYQRYQCLYHNVPTTSQSFSLYNDHHCHQDMFPRTTTAILEVHTDEVWNLEWSHNGRWLASASKDKTVIIWSIGTEAEPTMREYSPELVLKDHQYPVGCLAWSLDDSILLSSSDQYIKMWNTKTGVCFRTLDAHTETVSALAWVPDGSGFISGSQDRKIILWGSDGKQRDSWGITGIRITDLAVTPDFTRLVAVGESATGPSSQHPAPSGRGDSATPPVGGSRNNTHANSNASRSTEYLMIVYDLATKQPEVYVSSPLSHRAPPLFDMERLWVRMIDDPFYFYVIRTVVLEGQLTSVKISDDSQYALINHAPDEVHLWDISTGRMARKYTGQRQGRHIIRSCFGGVDGNFVVSGSEDGNVYVWHRDRGILLDVLSGHGSGSVNSVAWNPRNKRMFASCSDDFTIRIWEPTPAAVSRQASSSRAADGMLLEREPEPSGKGKGKRREPWDDSALDGSGSRGAQI